MGIADTDHTSHMELPMRPTSSNAPDAKNVSQADWETRAGHKPCVLWFTGFSGAGKSTIAVELERELFKSGKLVFVLDGDTLRRGLCNDLNFSPEDRKENIRRVSDLAKLLTSKGFICIAALISPYNSDREMAREKFDNCRFVEVFINAPMSVCEQRDPKGLYAKARAGKIPEFTGVSAPYEAPKNPDIELRTDRMTVKECVDAILDYLKKNVGCANC